MRGTSVFPEEKVIKNQPISATQFLECPISRRCVKTPTYRRSPRTLEPFPTLLEYDMSENALRTALAQEPMRHSGGIVAVPQGPGLGIAIDREVLQQYCEPPLAHYDKKPEEIPHQRATRGMLPAPQRQQSTRSL
jgi:hypothetical protein